MSVLNIPTRLLQHLREIATARPLNVLNLGAGVQSSTLLVQAAAGLLPRPDVAIFADTGWEPQAVYRHLERLESDVAAPTGIPIVRVQAGNIRVNAVRPHGHFATMPLHLLGPDGRKGILRRGCTQEHKVRPISRAVRTMLGATISGSGRIGPAPAGRMAIQMIGFSADEQHRVLDDAEPHVELVYPLIEHGLTRQGCQNVLASHGLGDTPRSACIGCPFHGNAAWRRLRDTSPAEWADACEVDELLRHGHPAAGTPLRGTAYLHRSRTPLREAPIEAVTAAEWAARQGELDLPGSRLDLAAFEEDPPAGCSPYGCRTTVIPPVAAVEAAA